MNIYLDEDSAQGLLAQLLTQGGHDVQRPADVGLSGEDDPIHLAHAIRQGRVLLTRNHDDFANLHDLIQAAQGHHPGLLVVCRENNPKRDLDAKGIVRALTKLLAAGVSLTDAFHILNQWR